MAHETMIQEAFRRFDEANANDPHTETWQGRTYPKEVLYAIRMTERLNDFAPGSPIPLRLAARCQHIRRWEIPRESYPMDRTGYLQWRRALKKFHAEKASAILEDIGFDKDIIDQVAFLLQKKQLKRNEQTQTLEDVICLVFLEYYFDAFAEQHPDEKLIDILRKTWHKMSEEGREAALALPLSKKTSELIHRALEG